MSAFIYYVFYNFSRTGKNSKMAKPNHFCWGYIWTFWYFDVLLWPGEKKFLPFRAMSKQCEFSTLQGVSNQVTHQTHPSTADNDRHHPNTPHTSSRHHSDISIHLLTSTETNWHKQTPTDTPRHSQTLSGVVWCWLKVTFWRLLVSVGMCWRLLLSGDI